MDISIVIICHHDRGYLQQAIDSAKAQDFRGEWEIVLQMSTMTMAQNTNAGARRANGEYIKWLHDDDMLMPDCLTNLWTARGADVICADAVNVHDKDNNFEGEDVIVKSTLPRSMPDVVERYNIHAGTLMYRRQVLIDNPLDESLWTGEEYELNMRLFYKGYKFAYVPKVVTRYRVHQQMKSYSGYGSVPAEVFHRRHDELMRIQDMYIGKRPISNNV